MRNIPINDYYQRGQVLLISLLVLVIGLTVGLSVATRSITTVRMTTSENSSQKAFTAAEAGIERALLSTASATQINGSFSTSNSSYQTTISNVSQDQFFVNNGSLVLKDDPADVWLAGYPDYGVPYVGDLDIYWGINGDSNVCNGPNNVPDDQNNPSAAAMEIIAITGTSKANPQIAHYAFDPCNGAAGVRSSYNNFSAPTLSGSLSILGTNFQHGTRISFTAGSGAGLLVRIIPLYSSTHIGIKGTNLPAQGTVYTSVGTSGDAQRKIVTFRGFPKVPIELYPFLIFCAGTCTMQAQ